MPLAEDEHPDVRAAACHALGVLVVFPSLREVRTNSRKLKDYRSLSEQYYSCGAGPHVYVRCCSCYA